MKQWRGVIILGFVFLFLVLAQTVFAEDIQPPILEFPIPQAGAPFKTFQTPQPDKCPKGVFIVKDNNGREIDRAEGRECLEFPWIAEFINAWYKWLVSIIGIVAVMLVVWGGIQWISAGGNSERVNSAKETIVSALVGLILLLGAYVFLGTVNPALVQLKGIIVPGIARIPWGPAVFCTEELYKQLKQKNGVEPLAPCGSRISDKTGVICASQDEQKNPGKISGLQYQNCCRTGVWEQGGGAEKEGAGVCCVATKCPEFEICMLAGTEYKCVKQNSPRGTITCDDSHYAKALQLWATCKDTSGQSVAFLMASASCNQAAPAQENTSFCTACNKGSQSYNFDNFNKTVNEKIKARCQLPLFFFFGTQLENNKVYYFGHTGPLHKKPFDSLYSTPGEEFDAAFLSSYFDPEQGNSLFTSEELGQGGKIFDATKRAGRWASE